MVPPAFEGDGAFCRSRECIDSGVWNMVGTRDDDFGDGNKNPGLSPDEAKLSARLTGLDQRLSRIRNDRAAQADQTRLENEAAPARASAMAVGLRLSSELVAGVLVGAALGWGLDYMASTSPWGMIVFLLVGFAAGVMNVMRAAGLMAKQSDRLRR